MTGQLQVPTTRVEELALEIQEEIRLAWKHTIGHSIVVGSKLTEAKELLHHGLWLDWLQDNFDMHPRTAQRLMRLAANASTVSHLPTQREAMAAIAAPAEDLCPGPPREKLHAIPVPSEPPVDVADHLIKAVNGSIDLQDAHETMVRERGPKYNERDIDEVLGAPVEPDPDPETILAREIRLLVNDLNRFRREHNPGSEEHRKTAWRIFYRYPDIYPSVLAFAKGEPMPEVIPHQRPEVHE